MKQRNLFAFLICISFFMHISTYGYQDKRLILGTMQFPQTIKLIPNDLRVYHSGNKIKMDSYENNNRLTFSLLVDQHQIHFYLLITEEFKTVVDYENTIKYLKIDPSKPYKLYLLQQDHVTSKRWSIKEQALPSGRIPDSAIIVCYPPEYIHGLYGGNDIELPKIAIKENILDVIGSEAVLHDRSHKILLSCLDYDALHSPLNVSVKQANHLTTIVALDT